MLDYPIMGEREDRAQRAQITVDPKVAVRRGVGCRLRIGRVGAEQQVQPMRRRGSHLDHDLCRLVRQDTGAEGERSPDDIDAQPRRRPSPSIVPST